jgi:hypothetical protein
MGQTATFAVQQSSLLLDPVGGGEQGLRHGEPERLRGVSILTFSPVPSHNMSRRLIH